MAPCETVDLIAKAGIGVTIGVKGSDGRTIAGAQCVKGTSDENGAITFTIPKETIPFSITIYAKGYKPSTITIDPLQTVHNVVLEMGYVTIIRGKVRDEHNAGIENTIVSIYAEEDRPADDYGTAVSDSAGRFSIVLNHVLPQFELFSSKDGYVPQNRKVNGKGSEQLSEIVLTMKAVEAGFYGRVVDEEGMAVKNIRIYLENVEERKEDGIFRYFESENGFFCVTDVAAGTYDVSISSVANSIADRKHTVAIRNMEIKPGYMFGEIYARLMTMIETTKERH